MQHWLSLLYVLMLTNKHSQYIKSQNVSQKPEQPKTRSGTLMALQRVANASASEFCASRFLNVGFPITRKMCIFHYRYEYDNELLGTLEDEF